MNLPDTGIAIVISLITGLLVEPIRRWWKRWADKQKTLNAEAAKAQYRQALSYKNNPDSMTQLMMSCLMDFARSCSRVGTLASIVLVLRVLKGAGPVPNYMYMGLCCYGLLQFQETIKEFQTVSDLWRRVRWFEEYKAKLPPEITQEASEPQGTVS